MLKGKPDFALVSKTRLIVASIEDVAPEEGTKLRVEGFNSSVSEIDRLLRNGFRVILVVGGGSLGDEYASFSKRYERDSGEIRNRASEANSLLLIAGLKSRRIAVNASPILEISKLNEFVSDPNWKVVVVANQEREKRSSLVATMLSKQYRTPLIHITNAKSMIDQRP